MHIVMLVGKINKRFLDLCLRWYRHLQNARQNNKRVNIFLAVFPMIMVKNLHVDMLQLFPFAYDHLLLSSIRYGSCSV
jgi:hypothetical protein